MGIRLFHAAALSIALIFASNAAEATTLSFDSLGDQRYSNSTNFSVDNFMFSYSSIMGTGYPNYPNGFAKIKDSPTCYPLCTSSGRADFYSFNDGSLSLRASNGSSFSLSSFFAAQAFITTDRILDIFVIGTRTGGGTVTQEFATAPGAANTFQTFSLSREFTNLSSVLISGKIGVYGPDEFAIDHISVAAVPEPETYAMMMAGLGLLCLVGRRKKQSEESA